MLSNLGHVVGKGRARSQSQAWPQLSRAPNLSGAPSVLLSPLARYAILAGHGARTWASFGGGKAECTVGITKLWLHHPAQCPV